MRFPQWSKERARIQEWNTVTCGTWAILALSGGWDQMFNKGGNGEDYTAKGKFDVDLGDLRSSVTRRASTGRCPGQTTQNLVGGPSRRRADPLIRRGGLEKIKLGLKSRRGSAIALWRTKNTRCVDTHLAHPRPRTLLRKEY